METKSKLLFTGDTFYENGKGKIKDFTKYSQSDYENLKDRINSCKNLLNYDFENVDPFHYEIILKNGQSFMSRSLERFRLYKCYLP